MQDLTEQTRNPKPTLRTMAMPKDVNPNGDIFGGWVLSQMDIAGGIAAMERAHGRVATVAIEGMKFISPVNVGDVLSVYCSVSKIGRTSIAVSVEAWVTRSFKDTSEKVTEADFVFVAIDHNNEPRIVNKA